MLTNTERQQIVEEVNAGTYGIDEALDDIAAAQKGEEVRKALYAEALVLNREGHAGSTDMIARQQIANLQTSVNGQISTLRTEVGDDIDDLEEALNSGLATQNGRIAAQNATIANVVANYNVEYGSTELWASTGETGALAAGTTVTLSEDVSHFDYIDIYSFCGNSNVLDTVPVDAKLQSSAGYALRWVNLSDPGSGSYKAYVRIIETRLHIIGTTLTIDHQVTYRNGEEVNISGAEVTQSNRSTYMGEFGIMKIVGRKITANTEIEDVRIGADGTEYASAGQAVRAQIGDVADAIPAIDTTLSVSGAAADAKAVGDALAGKADADDLTALETTVSEKADPSDVTALDTRVTAVEDDVDDLKEDFNAFSGYTNYALTDGKYYTTNGQTVNIDAPSTNSGWKSCVIECTAGDNFYITGQSGSAPRLWCFVDASNSRTSAVVRSVAISGKTGDNLLITAPENTTHLICNFIATQPAKLTQGQTLPEVVNTLESEISNAVSVANGVFVTNVPELACILDANIYVTGYDKVAINYFWYNSPQHTAYETYINLKGYKNGAWESIIGAFSRATAPDNRPNIERVVVDGVFDLVINWSLISNPFTSTYNDTNRPVFKNTCLAIDYSETPQITPFEEQDTIKNIVVVDASGNGDYTTLTDAYASIKDSDLNNQYEIVVAEGTYQEQYLIPPPYTHTHGMKAETTIITSVGLPYYDAINDWASVFQMMNTCKLSNLTVISGTKYCIHEDDYSLSGKMVKCENVIFNQTKAHNNAVVGNGTQFYGTKYIFNNCTFINGSFTNHSNTRLQKGANQHTILNSCKFVDAVITLSAVPTSADGEKGLYLFDINGCSFNPTQNTLVMKFGEPITGSSKLNYPWMVGGFGNDGININFDNANDTRFTDAWDSVNLSNKTFVKATEAITKGDHVTANGAITTASDYYGTALSNGNTGDYVPIWKQ